MNNDQYSLYITLVDDTSDSQIRKIHDSIDHSIYDEVTLSWK